MFTKNSPVVAISVFLSLAVATYAYADDWIDDFQTEATYDSASLFAPLYGGSATKYTLFAFTDGDNIQFASGLGWRFI